MFYFVIEFYIVIYSDVDMLVWVMEGVDCVMYLVGILIEFCKGGGMYKSLNVEMMCDVVKSVECVCVN